jgi:hypothetical protein
MAGGRREVGIETSGAGENGARPAGPELQHRTTARVPFSGRESRLAVW